MHGREEQVIGLRNYLIEGVSCSGKTSVCRELARRGYHALNGDVVLAYKGDPETGLRLDRPAFKDDRARVDWVHRHQIWDVEKVKSLVADQREPVTFFCGGSRNLHQFVDLFDGIFVLDLDRDTLKARLDRRVDEWGSEPTERDLVLHLHTTKESIPAACILIDATMPLGQVVAAILLEISPLG